jgi:large subunit ribosomal protein L29
MTAKEIRELSVAEIETKIREAQEQLLNMRLRKQTGQVEKTHAIRATRKDIARFKTELTARQQAAAKQPAA